MNPQSRLLESHRSAWITPGQQLSLFVIPLIVIVAWITGFPLGLLFDPFESVALYLAGMCILNDVMRPAIDVPQCFHPLFYALSSYWYP